MREKELVKFREEVHSASLYFFISLIYIIIIIIIA